MSIGRNGTATQIINESKLLTVARIAATAKQDYITAANTILADKIIFGSAFPCISLPDALKLYLEVGVKMESLPKILYDNAARFLGLE